MSPALRTRPGPALLCLAVAALVVLLTAQFRFRPASPVANDGKVSPLAQSLAREQLQLWQDPVRQLANLHQLRRTNPEWDFMGRTFLVLALGEMALREPDLAREHLRVVDGLVRGTVELEAAQGPYVFLMNYARLRPFRAQPVRSLFVDGEIALMLGVRCRMARQVGHFPGPELATYRSELAARALLVRQTLEQAPTGWVESYPDECWLFDHAFAAAALCLADRELGTDHAQVARRWWAKVGPTATEALSGLPHSSFQQSGSPLEGPEGSTLWITAHLLEAIDPSAAAQLYERTKSQLGRELWGFGWSREWPRTLRAPADVDSGVVVPGLDASPSASGLALVGAAGRRDLEWLGSLQASLELAAFPIRREGGLRYAAANGVGDAVLLYALTVGPLWKEICTPSPHSSPAARVTSAPFAISPP